jgi:MHS family proline/betaine transporter-like MFS transporter
MVGFQNKPQQQITKSQKMIIFGSWLGWSLDGYDLVLMLFIISSISQLFFPSKDPTLSLLAIFATYTVTLVMRPVGGALFGSFGDKHGRKNAMIITVSGFSTATFLTGLLPTWQSVGILAPILLILLRFAQGLFAGGEWASGAVITMETASKSMRGFLSGFVQSGYTFGFLIASIVFQMMLSAYPGNSFISGGGWRIIFYTGIIPGLIALFVGFKMNESELWLKKVGQKKTEGSPLRKGMGSPLRKIIGGKEARKRFLLALIVMTGLMYAYYTTMGFMPTFLQKYLNIETHEAATIMIAASISSLIGTVFAGFISQRIGRMTTLTLFASAAIILAIPTLNGLHDSTTITQRMFFTALLVFVASTAFGPIPAFLSERFPTAIRNSASGFVYNGGLIIGSWSPLIAIQLLSLAHPQFIPYALAINIIIGSIIILIGSRLNPDTRDADLD